MNFYYYLLNWKQPWKCQCSVRSGSIYWWEYILQRKSSYCPFFLSRLLAPLLGVSLQYLCKHVTANWTKIQKWYIYMIFNIHTEAEYLNSDLYIFISVSKKLVIYWSISAFRLIKALTNHPRHSLGLIIILSRNIMPQLPRVTWALISNERWRAARAM